MTLTVDMNVLIGAAGFLFLLAAAFLKNFVAITATTARSKANEERITDLEDQFHEFKYQTVQTYVTNETLKEAMSSFGASVDRLTDRLDRLITPRPTDRNTL